MLQLYYTGSGSTEIVLRGKPLPAAQWLPLKSAVGTLLRHRGLVDAAGILDSNPFTLEAATNSWGDDFHVLHASVDIDEYARLGKFISATALNTPGRQIALTLKELFPERYVRFVAVELNTNFLPDAVESPKLSITSDTVERALEDAGHLIASGQGATSAIDRVHTALHGYINALCRDSGIAIEFNEKMTSVFKKLREQHPKLTYNGPRSNEIDLVFKATATIVDSINTLRNNASIAHPNETVIPQAEAMFLINLMRSLLHFIEMRVHA
jgi:hypothetical protein